MPRYVRNTDQRENYGYEQMQEIGALATYAECITAPGQMQIEALSGTV